MTNITVLFCETPESSPPGYKLVEEKSHLLAASRARSPLRARAPPLRGGAPAGHAPLLPDTFLGQLVLASGGGMGWLGSTRQGLFTMADDLEQQ